MQSSAEFDAAFKKAQEAYPCISRSLARAVIDTFDRRHTNNKRAGYAKSSFVEVVRLTLNECRVTGETERKCYAALIGFFFGKRGNAVKKQRLQQGLPKRIASVPTSPRVGILVDEKTRQQGWDF